MNCFLGVSSNQVVEDNLDLGKEKHPFYKYNNDQDYVELHGLPYQSRCCMQPTNITVDGNKRKGY